MTPVRFGPTHMLSVRQKTVYAHLGKYGCRKSSNYQQAYRIQCATCRAQIIHNCDTCSERGRNLYRWKYEAGTTVLKKVLVF